jgi:hypothetical protein
MFEDSVPRAAEARSAMGDDNAGARTGGEAEPPSAAPAPPVLLDLPDGQQLRAALLGQWQSPDGGWWLDVEIQAWAHVRERERDRSEPAPVIVTAAARHVHKIADTSYAGVPTRRYRPGTRSVPVPAPRHAP